jgi:hypothetical protein
MPIIVEVVASKNPPVGNTDNSGNMEVLPSMYTCLQNSKEKI